MVVLRGARPSGSRTHIERSEGAYAANLARGSIAPFSGTAEQSNLPYFLSCAGAHLDIERGGKPVGGRELLAGGREPDAGGARRRIGDMLDRLCTEMAHNAGRKSGAETPGKLYACRSHHRRASESRSPGSSQKRAGYTLDRRVSVSPPATRPALL